MTTQNRRSAFLPQHSELDQKGSWITPELFVQRDWDIKDRLHRTRFETRQEASQRRYYFLGRVTSARYLSSAWRQQLPDSCHD